MDAAGGSAGPEETSLGVSGAVRSRLARLGARALSNTELVALVTGLREPRAAELMRHGLDALAAAPLEQLVEESGVSELSAQRLLAATELARRLGVGPDARPRLSTPAAIFDYARRRLGGLRREEFHVLCFNNRNVLLRHARAAEGSVDQCHVDPREVLAPALACRASGVVLLHNHPSGDPEPSVFDLTLTRQLADGARLLCLRILDHLVITDRAFVSMRSRGLLAESAPTVSTRIQSP